MIPSSNAALTATDFDKSFTQGGATYVLALNDTSYRYRLNTPSDAARLQITTPDGVSYLAVRANSELNLDFGNYKSTANVKLNFGNDTNIVKLALQNSKGVVLSESLVVLVRSEATFTKAKLALEEG
jgi:hypothetical protein